MLEVGLTATFKKISFPFVIPPLIPPLLLDEVFPLLSIKQSLNLLPKNSVPLNPAPNSTPLIPGIEKIIDERTDSIESKKGSPKPIGTFLIVKEIIPPKESPECVVSSK